jgi:hypothetical protein
MMTKHSQMKVVVLRPGVVLPVSGTLYNATTDAFNPGVGGGAFFVETVNSGNPTATNNPAAPVKFIQVRDTSGDPATLYTRPLEETQWISSACYLGIKIGVTNAQLATNSLLIAGNGALSGVPAAAASNQVTPDDEFTYRIQISAHGDRTDWYNSVYNTPTAFGTFTTAADFTTTYPAVANQRDVIYESIAYNFNGNNGNIAVVFCVEEIAVSFGNGSVSLTDLIDPTIFSNTSKFIIGYTLDGKAVTMKMDNDVREALTELDTLLGAGDYALRPYFLPGTPAVTAAAPYNAGVIPTAGTAPIITNICALAIDEGQATYDYKINTKRRITLGLIKGFDNVPQTIVTDAKEGLGTGRQLSIMYKANEAYNQAARPQPYMSYHVQFPNEIQANAYYDFFYIEHCHQRLATSGMPAIMPHTTVIAVPNFTIGGSTVVNPLYGSAGFTLGVPNPNPQRAVCVTTLNNFDSNFNLGNPNLV